MTELPSAIEVERKLELVTLTRRWSAHSPHLWHCCGGISDALVAEMEHRLHGDTAYIDSLPTSEADPAAIHMQNYGIYPSGVPPTSTFQCITSNHNRYLADCGDACRGSQEYLIPSGGHLCTIGDSGAGESPQLQWTIQGMNATKQYQNFNSVLVGHRCSQ